jgi:hypothetical protein
MIRHRVIGDGILSNDQKEEVIACSKHSSFNRVAHESRAGSRPGEALPETVMPSSSFDEDSAGFLADYPSMRKCLARMVSYSAPIAGAMETGHRKSLLLAEHEVGMT